MKGEDIVDPYRAYPGISIIFPSRGQVCGEIRNINETDEEDVSKGKLRIRIRYGSNTIYFETRLATVYLS